MHIHSYYSGVHIWGVTTPPRRHDKAKNVKLPIETRSICHITLIIGEVKKFLLYSCTWLRLLLRLDLLLQDEDYHIEL
jgi:hypothetical protein